MPKNSSASKAPLWPVVNRSEESIQLNLKVLFQPIAPVTDSPIDEYYSYSRDLLLSAAKPEVESNEMLMRLHVLELVSTAELYFRRILSGVINVCPKVADVAAKRPLLLGSLNYYPRRALGYALLDGISLSGEGDIKRQTLNITGFDIKPTSSVGAALISFEKVCQLRHVIVHAKGEVGAKNVAELQLAVAGQSRLKVTALSFQPLVVVTHNAVRAYNSFLFESVLRSWLSGNVLRGQWRVDKRQIIPLFDLFRSVTDGALSDVKVAYEGFRSFIK